MSLNAIWDKDYTATKGFLLGGYTQSEEKVAENDEAFWLLYLNDKGEEIWRKYVKSKFNKNQERLVSVMLNTDGTYILAGTSTEELGKENWKIVKLRDKEINQLIEKQNLKVYPNPVSDYCYVEIGKNFREAEIYIYDMGGRLIQSIKTKNPITKLNTKNLVQGMYIISAKIENQKFNTKIVKT